MTTNKIQGMSNKCVRVVLRWILENSFFWKKSACSGASGKIGSNWLVSVSSTRMLWNSKAYGSLTCLQFTFLHVLLKENMSGHGSHVMSCHGSHVMSCHGSHVMSGHSSHVMSGHVSHVANANPMKIYKNYYTNVSWQTVTAVNRWSSIYLSQCN